VSEACGTGTAAVVSPVGAFSYRGEEVPVNRGRVGDLTRKLYQEITGIQYGEIEDRHRWVQRVE
jgi:branched-chain amino acid aminotransferase